MFCQRADVRQRQLPFAAQNHRAQRPVKWSAGFQHGMMVKQT
jgi:hypothetical protein